MIKTGVYVRNKDEANIIEFMEHYYSLGFDYIIILDDHSKIHPSSIIGDRFVNKYKIIQIEKNIIDKFTYSTDYLNDDNLFIVSILPELKQNMDYCLYVDMDEYLVIKKYKNINEVIDYYQPFDQLKINWLFFGNNDIKICQDLSNLKPLFTKSALKLNRHVKSIVNLSKIQNLNNPHFFITKNGINKNILNELTDESPFEYSMTNYCFKEIDIYIAHYITQDTYSFIYRRFTRNTSHLYLVLNNINDFNDKCITKHNLLNYINDNINTIIGYVHGDNDDESIFIDIYRYTFAYIKNVFFASHNCNEIKNFDLHL